MKGIIIYKGKYGATAQYAAWIGEELHIPLFEKDDHSINRLHACDYVIIGSAVYMGRLLLYNWLRRNMLRLKNKKLFLFIVCATLPEKGEKLDQIVRENLPAELREQCAVFFLRGRIIKKHLSWKHRIIAWMAARATKDPVEKQEMMQGFDAVKKENITSLLNAVKKWMIPGGPGISQANSVHIGH